MLKINLKFLWMIWALGLVVVPTALVSAKSLSSISISGPGIKGEITLREEGPMRKLLESGFLFGEFSLAQKPDDPGEGYQMRAFLYLDGPTVPFVELTYYPPPEGQQGLIHYTARLGREGTQLEPVDDWRNVPSNVAADVNAIFNSQGVTLQPVDFSDSGKSVTTVSNRDVQKAQGSSPNSWTAWLRTAVWIPIAVLLGYILKRLTIKPRPSTGD